MYVKNFYYGTNTIIVDCDDGWEKDTMQLDNNGYVISNCHNGYCTFTYKNGYLKEEKIAGIGYPIIYSWHNENMVQKTSDYKINYEYSNREDLLNINIFAYPDNYGYPFLLKLKGFSSKNCLAKTYATENSYSCITTYDYIFDKDGYPNQIILKCEEGVDNHTYSYTFKYILTYY